MARVCSRFWIFGTLVGRVKIPYHDLMAIDVVKLTIDELRSLIVNHRHKARTDAPLYLEALAELARREGKGLNFEKTKEIVLNAARDGRFLSYKELADASDVDWGQAHYAIGGHLFQLIEYAHLRGWPLLSAIVVNKPNVATGEMEPSTLKGFVGGARALNISVTDELAFLSAEQQRVFAWARSETTGGGAEFKLNR
jgi:hypothetical protein